MRPPPQPLARLTVALPATDELVTGTLPAIALSSDGTNIAYLARRDGRPQLFRRALGEAEPAAIPDSENAMSPFFSPDGAWLGFDQNGVLMKVRSAGGVPVPICNTGGLGATASWSDRHEIVFASTTGRGLLRVPATGGQPVQLTRVDLARGEVVHALPDVLPGGRAAVFTIVGNDSADIAAVRLDTGKVTRVTTGRQARYASSGHLLVLRGDTLWAARFDPDTLTLRGQPLPAVRGLDPAGTAHFATASNGTLAYVLPAEFVPPRSLARVDRGFDGARHDIQPDRGPAALQLVLVQNWSSELAARAAQSR
jgi:hypothetical protein